MKKNMVCCVILLLIFCVVIPVNASTQVGISGKGNTGRLFMSGKMGQIKNPDEVPSFLKSKLKSWMANNSDLTFQVKKVKKDELNMTHYRTQQYYRGIPLYGQEVIVHTDRSGQVKTVNGQAADTVNVQTTPGITKDMALSIARKSVNAPPDTGEKIMGKDVFSEKADLMIYGQDSKYYLVYVVEMNFMKPCPGSWKLFIDAASGEVLKKLNRLDQFTSTTGTGLGYYHDSKTLKVILDDDGKYRLIEKTYPDLQTDKNIILTADYDILGMDVCYPNINKIWNSSSQETGVDASYYIHVTHDYFKDTFGRNSYDGLGDSILVWANDTDEPINASSSAGNGIMYFGAGGTDDGTEYAPFSSGLDIVAHEYTHEITGYEEILEYQGESGALNESFSDVFACIIDPDWELGEHVVTPGISGGALRDLSDPAKYGQPANYRDYLETSSDYGGVHTNSGIPNKAFYNIATVIGRDAAARIYYRAITQYLTLTSDFRDGKDALLSAAEDIYGYKSPEYRAVAFGWGAVGIPDPYEITLSESTVNLPLNLTKAITADLITDNQSSQDVTNTADWSSSNELVATVNHGLLISVGTGTAVITADWGGLQATVTVLVTANVLEIQVDKPAVKLLAQGPSTSILATAIYDDQTSDDVTQLATWESSDDSVATTSAGNVWGANPGVATITVSYGGKHFDIPTRVIPQQAASLALDIPTLIMKIAESVNLNTTATFTGYPPQNINEFCVWTSSNTRIATVSNTGLVTGIAVGKATITAKFGSKSVKAAVTITPVANSIFVDKPAIVSVIGGSAVRIKVSAYYVGSTRATDVSKLAVWEVDPDGIGGATVSSGAVKGLVKGEASITVTYQDFSISIPVTVIPKVTSLTAEPASLDLTTGTDPTAVAVTAHYIDGSEETVTGKAAWKSSRTSVVTVTGGAISPVSKGTASVTVEFGGKRVTIKVTVTPPVTSIVIDKPIVSLLSGRSASIKATAYYSDGSSARITTNPTLTWTAAPGGVVTVNRGALKAAGVGETEITFNYKGAAAVCEVKVSPAVASLSAPPIMQLVVGDGRTPLVVMALYSGGLGAENVTDFATLTTSKASIVTVEPGMITPVSAGTATITAKFGGKSVVIKVTVV